MAESLLPLKKKDGTEKKPVTRKGVKKAVTKALDATDQKIQDALKPLTDKFGRLDELFAKVETLVKPPADPNKKEDPNKRDDAASDTEMGRIRAQLADAQRTIADQGKLLNTEKEERVKASERADKSDRQAAIRLAMGNYALAKGAEDTAFRLINMEVDRAEDGSLVGGKDKLPLEAFVKEVFTAHDYFLAPVDVTGVNPPKGMARGSSTVGIEDITPDMKPETKAAVYAQMSKAAQALQ
jgi:hypothetical protein